MTPVSPVAPVLRLPSRPAAAGAGAGHATGGHRAPGVALVRAPAGASPARTAVAHAGRGAYAAAAYAAAGALRRPAAGEAVELSVRVLADGGRLTVARRVAGDRTLGIEAQVA